MSIASFLSHISGKEAKKRHKAVENQLKVLVSKMDAAEKRSASRIQQLEKTLKTSLSEIKSLRLKLDPPEIILTGNEDTWKTTAQAGELAFHKKKNIRAGETWTSGNEEFWRNQGFSPEGWEGKFIIDVGAGSRLRTLFFKGAKIAAIEPLFDQFKAEVEWNDLDQAAEAYPIAAEVLIPELVGRADLIVSINALDHGFHFEEAIRNLRKYMKPVGLAFLSYDQHEKPDHMHPLVLNDEISRGIFERSGFRVEKFKEKSRYHGGDTGPNALCYWLRPV